MWKRQKRGQTSRPGREGRPVHLDDDLERGAHSTRWMTHDSQSAHCPAHPSDYYCSVHIYNIRMPFEPSPDMAIMPELPHVTELRLRRTIPFRQITCSITSVWCKHDYIYFSLPLSPISLSLSLFPVSRTCTSIGNRINLIKRVQQETSGACCGSIMDYDKINVILAKKFRVKRAGRIAVLNLQNIVQIHKLFSYNTRFLTKRTEYELIKRREKRCDFKKNVKNI